MAAVNSRPATTMLLLRGTSDNGRCIMFSMTSVNDEIAAMPSMPEFGDGPNNVVPIDVSDIHIQAANNIYDHFVGGVAQ